MVPPYVPYRTFQNYMVGLKKGIPGRIDRSVLPSMSGSMQVHLIHALKALKLIDDRGDPMPTLQKVVAAWPDEQARHGILMVIVHEAYPFLFRGGFNLQTASPSQIAEAFGTAGAQGDTVRKCIAFFIGLAKDAGIVISPHVKNAGKGFRSTRRPRKNGNAPQIEQREIDVQPHDDVSPNVVSILLDKFPTFDPSWSPDVQAKWFDAYERLMKAAKS